MKTITLNKGEDFYIENKCYVIINGKGIIKYITPNGKTTVNESILKTNDILYNSLSISNSLINEYNFLKNIETLFKAFEITILKEIKFDKLLKDKLLLQISYYYTLKELHLIMTTTEYILITLKRYSCNNIIDKTIILYDDFNISRSQFYLIIQNLKKENILIENNNNYILNY